MRRYRSIGRLFFCCCALAFLALGCGAQGYGGTWKATWNEGLASQTLVIEPVGDHWKVIDSLGRPHTFRLVSGRLVDSDSSHQAFELRDGKLAMLDDSGGVVVEFHRQ